MSILFSTRGCTGINVHFRPSVWAWKRGFKSIYPESSAFYDRKVRKFIAGCKARQDHVKYSPRVYTIEHCRLRLIVFTYLPVGVVKSNRSSPTPSPIRLIQLPYAFQHFYAYFSRHAQLKHEIMNRNTETAQYLSVQLQLSRGFITITKI